MTMKSDALNLLENAYTLETPEDNKQYYTGFAPLYDQEFATGLGYGLPHVVARKFSDLSTNSDFPIADIGCGTGLVAEALPMQTGRIDGMDISEQMLDIARGKQLYRKLYQVDLTASLSSIVNDYGAVLSAGTFTHGHLGPESLAALLKIAKANALFVVAVNKAHFQQHGFDQLLEKLHGNGQILDVAVYENAIYARRDHAHSEDMACIVCFRKV